MLKFIFFTYLMVFYSMQSSANGRLVGNGGDIILCEQGDIYLLDHYEARIYRNLTIDFEVTSDSVDERVERALGRLERLSPDRAQKYREWANSFYDEANFQDNIVLHDINDSAHIAIPEGCQIRQIVNQASVVIAGQKRYLVDNTYWARLNPDQKAGLILHELAYREALEFSHQDSIAARLLSSIIASPMSEQMKLIDFVELLIQLDYPTLRIQGVLLELFHYDSREKVVNEVRFYNESLLRSAQITTRNSDYYHPVWQQYIPIRHRIEFFPNGKIKSIYLKEQFYSHEKNLLLAPQLVKFHENGKLALATVAKQTYDHWPRGELRLRGHYETHPNGLIKTARIDKGHWQSPWGKLELKDYIILHANGAVKKVILNTDKKILHILPNEKIYGALELNPIGIVTSLKLSCRHGRRNSSLHIQGKNVEASCTSWIKIYEDGKVSSFISGGPPVRLKTTGGRIATYEFGALIRLDKNGYAIEN